MYCQINESSTGEACSPDGVFIDTSGDLNVLEIKSRAADKDSEICTADYLDANGNLKRNHKYYAQVQFQMHVCNASQAWFLVWVPKDPKIVIIGRDEEYIEQNFVRKLEKLYFEELLPALLK